MQAKNCSGPEKRNAFILLGKHIANAMTGWLKRKEKMAEGGIWLGAGGGWLKWRGGDG